jgi:hypothetical protein
MSFLDDLLSFKLASFAGLLLIPGLVVLVVCTGLILFISRGEELIVLEQASGYLILLGIYNIFFHPLSKHPGPKLYAATRLTWSLDVISGKSAFILTKLHEKYGEVV